MEGPSAQTGTDGRLDATVAHRTEHERTLGSCAVTEPLLLGLIRLVSALVERLRGGDEDAFMMLVERQQAMMLRIARMYVSSQAVAEEVVQDAWLGKSCRAWASSRGARRCGRGCTGSSPTSPRRVAIREGRSQPFSGTRGTTTKAHRSPTSWLAGAGRDVSGRLDDVPERLAR